jgi:hypothetical protein
MYSVFRSRGADGTRVIPGAAACTKAVRIAKLVVLLAAMAAMAAMAALAACGGAAGSAPSPSGPASAPGPRLVGRMTVATDDGGVGQLTATANGRTSYDQIVPGGKPSGNPTPAALSSDGSTLAYGTSQGITLHDMRTGANRVLYAPDSGDFNFSVNCVDWSPGTRSWPPRCSPTLAAAAGFISSISSPAA